MKDETEQGRVNRNSPLLTLITSDKAGFVKIDQFWQGKLRCLLFLFGSNLLTSGKTVQFWLVAISNIKKDLIVIFFF